MLTPCTAIKCDRNGFVNMTNSYAAHFGLFAQKFPLAQNMKSESRDFVAISKAHTKRWDMGLIAIADVLRVSR